MTFLSFSRCESQGHVVKNEVKDFLARGVNVFRSAVGPLNVKS